MEEIFCMEWNMEEIFRYGMEDGMEKNCRYGIWKNRLPFHSITCPARGNYRRSFQQSNHSSKWLAIISNYC